VTCIHLTGRVWSAKEISHPVLQIQRRLPRLGHPAHKSNQGREHYRLLAIFNRRYTFSRCPNLTQQPGRMNDCLLLIHSILRLNISINREHSFCMNHNHSGSCHTFNKPRLPMHINLHPPRLRLIKRHTSIHLQPLSPPRPTIELIYRQMVWVSIGNQFPMLAVGAQV